MSQTTDRADIIARYQAYCDACQTSQLKKLEGFWVLPAMFLVDLGGGQVVHKIVQTYDELEALYSTEFGASTGVNQTVIDHSTVKFFGANLATIETHLRHLAHGKQHDVQSASYGCRKINGTWWFVSHISEVTQEVNEDA